MKERPILFSAPMVRAVLSGSKTQTRRVITGRVPREAALLLWLSDDSFDASLAADPENGWCPYGYPGDRLWVRETHAQFAIGNKSGLAPQCVAYRATCGDDNGFDYVHEDGGLMRVQVTKWTPAIHMPRWASRITLELTNVSAQPLCDVREDDAIAEGAQFHNGRGVGHSGWRHDRDHGVVYPTARDSFRALWDSINGKRPGCSWKDDPWAWVLTFRVVP